MAVRFARTFIIGFLVILIGVVPSFAQDQYSEAPMLAEMVTAGSLPPIAERLPENPMVVEPAQMGEYGGVWRRLMTGVGDDGNLERTVSYEPLVRWDTEYNLVIPNVAERWEVSEDGREFTFYLRRGMKWSDGMPFTADDIRFWYEDVANNSDLNPSGIDFLIVAGETAQFEVIDDYTVKFAFAEPAGLFLPQLAQQWGIQVVYYARHYFEQFHPSYNPDVEADAEAAGFDDWATYFWNRGGDHYNPSRWSPDVPTLDPWMAQNPLQSDTTQLNMVRNPYYWKVDPQGRQYPYIDQLTFEIVPEVENMVLRAANGEVDMQERHINSLDNRAFFVDNQEQGDYHLVDLISTDSNSSVLQLNLTSRNPVLREIFQNRDFRVALSYAINRQEVIDTLYFGITTPAQPAPLPGTALFNEQLATQYTEYNVDLANQMLDEAGFAERDSEGFRLGPDGNRISFTMVFSDFPVNAPQVMEFVQRYWREVGIDMQPRQMPREAFDELVYANGHDAALWGGEGGIRPIGRPHNFMPVDNNAWFASAWGIWSESPDDPNAETPTNEGAKRQIELFEQIKQTADQDEQNQLMSEILEIAAEEFWTIGISTPEPSFAIVRDNFFNVPDAMPLSWEWPTPAPANTFTFFFGSSS
jgi:peptide/nickel transport system substrate-binding protein